MKNILRLGKNISEQRKTFTGVAARCCRKNLPTHLPRNSKNRKNGNFSLNRGNKLLADLPFLLQKINCGSVIEINSIALRPGNVIDIPEGVKHWHGAQRDSWFQHIATHVQTADASGNEWLEAVSDEDYGKLQ